MSATVKSLIKRYCAPALSPQSDFEGYLSSILTSRVLSPMSRDMFDSEAIPESIQTLFACVQDGTPLVESQINAFCEWLKGHDIRIRTVLIYVLRELLIEQFSVLLDSDALTSQIDECIRKKVPIRVDNPGINSDALLSAYHVLSKINEEVSFHANDLLFVRTLHQREVNRKFLFSINALLLAGIIPKAKSASGLDLTRPLTLGKTSQHFAPTGAIKDAHRFYAYRAATKIFKGDTPNTVYVMTDGKKLLYVRCRYSPYSVLASKIAHLVSAEHFSSERVVSNGHIASRELEGYKYPAITHWHNPHAVTVKELTSLKEKQIIVKGTGIIDEVNNFVGETDLNPENYAFSAADPKIAKIVKIDFDFCGFAKNSSAFANRVSKLFKITQGHPPVTERKAYQIERLQTQLFLSLVPDELFKGLIDKSFGDEHDPQKEATLTLLVEKREHTIQKFLTELNAKELFLQDIYPQLGTMKKQFELYIKRHFRPPYQSLVLEALLARIQSVCELIQKEYALDVIPLPQVIPEQSPPQEICSMLSAEQEQGINQLIKKLEREIASFWPLPHKERKKIKVAALKSVLDLSATGMHPLAIIEKIKKDYPDAYKGDWSQRTRIILDSLEQSFTAHDGFKPG